MNIEEFNVVFFATDSVEKYENTVLCLKKTEKIHRRLLKNWRRRIDAPYNLYLQEHFLSVHHPQDEVHNGGVAKGDKCGVEVAHILLQTVEERARYTAEVDAGS